MKLTEWVMRLLAPTCERQRQEFRAARERVEASAADLVRTVKTVTVKPSENVIPLERVRK